MKDRKRRIVIFGAIAIIIAIIVTPRLIENIQTTYICKDNGTYLIRGNVPNPLENKDGYDLVGKIQIYTLIENENPNEINYPEGKITNVGFSAVKLDEAKCRQTWDIVWREVTQ